MFKSIQKGSPYKLLVTGKSIKKIQKPTCAQVGVPYIITCNYFIYFLCFLTCNLLIFLFKTD